MGLSGQWKSRSVVPQATARVWGNGWRDVHAARGGPGRGITPRAPSGVVPEQILDEFAPEAYGYVDEDFSSAVFGYGIATGTASRPGWGTEDVNTRGSVGDFPPAAPRRTGIPGGTLLRSRNVGADAKEAKTVQRPGLTDDTRYKSSGDVEDSVTPDPSQLVVQSSAVQRDKVRTGSQTIGRENADRHSIASRIPGQRIPVYQGGERHYDMDPYQQDEIIRPFLVRTAATGDPSDMLVNEMYVSQPLQREPVGDVYQGPAVVDGAGYDQYSYVEEDVLPYV